MTIIGASICGALVFGIWPEMWKSYGILGGWAAAAILISIAWYMNHWIGIIFNPEGLQTADGNAMQFGLIHQGARAAAPWIDMGWAIGMGLWVCSLLDSPKGQRGMLAVESAPRVLAVCVGGMIGGAFVGLIGYTGAELFKWADATQFPTP